MKRILKGTLIFIAILVAGLLLILAIESTRGARSWAETESYLNSKGEVLTFDELIPPLPPDDRNFCATPLIAAMTDYEETEAGEIVYRSPSRARLVEMRVPLEEGVLGPDLTSFMIGGVPDFEAWAKVFAGSSRFKYPDQSRSPPEQVLESMQSFETEFAELAEAAARPEAVFRIAWADDYMRRLGQAMNHHDDVIELAELFSIRAAAALAADQPATARESVHILFRLAEARGWEPAQFAQIMSLAYAKGVLDSVWYGLRENGWRDEDLVWLMAVLNTEALFERALFGFRTEMVGFYIQTFDRLKSSGSSSAGAELVDYMSGSLPAGLIPGGWWDQFKSDGCKILYDGAIDPLKNGSGFSHLRQDVFRYDRKNPVAGLVRISLSLSESQLESVAEVAAYFECARIACALELEHRETGRYPDELSELVPGRIDSVPADPMDGQPIRYLRIEGGRYRLHSIGLDGIDGGGKLLIDPETGYLKPGNGDLVWTYSHPERQTDGKEGGTRRVVLPP